MRFALRALGAALAAALLLAMSWASTAPLRVARTNDAIVRISLGARPERIETCRTQSEEDLAKLAPQMRQNVVCDGVTARYRLTIHRNGKLIYLQTVRGGGLRHDRQLYVSRDLRVPPGRSAFAMQLARIDTVANEKEISQPDSDESREQTFLPGRATREVDARRRRRDEAIPPDLRLTLDASLAPHEVLLVSYQQEDRRLITRRAKSPGR